MGIGISLNVSAAVWQSRREEASLPSFLPLRGYSNQHWNEATKRTWRGISFGYFLLFISFFLFRISTQNFGLSSLQLPWTWYSSNEDSFMIQNVNDRLLNYPICIKIMKKNLLISNLIVQNKFWSLSNVEYYN